MVVRVCFGVLIGLGAVLLGGDRAAAFCVYNKISQFKGDARIVAEVVQGGSWQAEIGKSGNECCSWEDARCNNSGRRDGMLSFRIISLQPGADNPRPCVIDIEAGGWIYVTVTRALGTSGSGNSSARLPVTSLKCTEVRYKR